MKAQSGRAGRLLAFGCDRNGSTFDYWVGVLPDARKLYLFEVGGRRDRFERERPELERAIASISFR